MSEVLRVTQLGRVIVSLAGHPGDVALLLHRPDHPRHRYRLPAQRVVVRDQHVDGDPGEAVISHQLPSWSVVLPVGVKSVEEILKYKYIISAPGNDKDSGLQWKLASNSIVLMPKPLTESWFMESKLEKLSKGMTLTLFDQQAA